MSSKPKALNKLWVADITYVRTKKGFGGRAHAHFRHYRCKHSTKRPKCARETTGLIHHSDHGSQYVSVVYNQRLSQHGITASTGTVGDSYDNALGENVNGPSQEVS